MKRKLGDLKRSLLQPILHTNSATLDLGSGSFVDYKRQIYAKDTAAKFFQILKEELDWEQRQITVFGRTVNQPRLINYQGDLQYTYSGQTLKPSPWHPQVLEIKRYIEELTSTTYNSVLLNYYLSGAHSISWHSDNEPLYGTEPIIATLSLGATRDFFLRNNADHSIKHQFNLASGDLLVMRGTTQEFWMHSLPKRAKEQDGRISLTFRKIVKPEEQQGKR